MPCLGCGTAGPTQNSMSTWSLISKQKKFKVNLWNALKSKTICNLFLFKDKRTVMETTSSSNVFFTAKNSISDQDTWYGRKTCLCRTSLCAASVATDCNDLKMKPPLWLPLATHFTKSSSTVICSNFNSTMNLTTSSRSAPETKYKYPNWVSSILENNLATFSKFILKWHWSMTITNHTRLFRAYSFYDFWDQLHIRIAIGGETSFSHILPYLTISHHPSGPPISKGVIKDS